MPLTDVNPYTRVDRYFSRMRMITTCIAAIVGLLCGATAMAQHNRTGETRWSAEAAVYTNVGDRKHRIAPALAYGHSDGVGMPLRLAVAYRWAENFHATVAVDRVELRSGGIQNNVDHTAWYEADEVTIGHAVNALFLGVGARSGPVGHGHVSLRAELLAGLRVVSTNASFGARHVAGGVPYAYWGNDLWDAVANGETAIAAWDQRSLIERQSAMGLSLGTGFRLHVHIGPHVSIIVPDIQMSLPLVKPGYAAVEQGAVRIPAHKLDLAYGIFGSGLAVHW